MSDIDPFPSSPEQVGRTDIAVLPFPSSPEEVGREDVPVDIPHETILAHQAGKHDQRRHAGGRGSGKGGDTMARYLRADGTWDPKRVAEVHEPALTSLTQGVALAENGKPVLYMTGGGYGSGKSSVLSDPELFPTKDKAVIVDPDAMKSGIPEYREKAFGANPDPDAATFVHEESSYLSKEGVMQSLQGGRSVVYDTSGDGEIENLEAKVKTFRAAGATRVEANYVFPGSVSEAQRRADLRASVPDASGLRRYVPPALLAANHRDVSQAWQAAAKRKVFDKQTLWSTAGAVGQKPTIIARASRGKVTVHNRAMYDAFVAVGKED